jgi:hypothetical protein
MVADKGDQLRVWEDHIVAISMHVHCCWCAASICLYQQPEGDLWVSWSGNSYWTHVAL